METYRLTPPVKFLWRDGYKVAVTSLATFTRHLSQPFGVNWAPNDIYHTLGWKGHPGIDIALPVGQPIYAAHAGKIVELDNTEDDDGQGIALFDPTQKIITWYWHISQHFGHLGEFVARGDQIALSGNGGHSYGPHCHFQLLQADTNGNILNANNGYGGGIDPIPHMIMPDVDVYKMPKEFVSDMYIFFFGRKADTDELDFWSGKHYRDLLDAMLKGRAGLFQQNALNI